MAGMTGDTPAEGAGTDDRSIAKPDKPKCGCACNCRADANDNIVGNLKPGKPKFAFGTATAASCAQASKEAKRNANKLLVCNQNMLVVASKANNSRFKEGFNHEIA